TRTSGAAPRARSASVASRATAARSRTDLSSRGPPSRPKLPGGGCGPSEIRVEAAGERVGRLGRRIELEVVDGIPVHGCRLPAGESERAITAIGLAPHRDLDVAPHTDPHDRQTAHGRVPLVPLVALDHHVVDHDVESAARDLGDRSPVAREEPSPELTDVEPCRIAVALEAHAVFAPRTLPRVDL